MLMATPIGSFMVALGAWWLQLQQLAPPTQQHVQLLVAALCALAWAAWGVLWLRSRNEAREALAPLGRSLLTACVGLGLAHSLTGAQTGVVWHLIRPGLQVLAPTCLALGIGCGTSQTRALISMSHAPIQEVWRVHKAGRASRIVMLSVISFAALNHAALTFNRTWDLSHFRRSDPGEKCRNIVQHLSAPIILRLFFPPSNDVLQQVRDYAEALARLARDVTVEVVDQAQEPALARELKVRRNGMVAVTQGKKTELITIGLDVDAARAPLRRLDAEMASALTRVTQATRVVYLTDGHNERGSTQGGPRGPDADAGLSEFAQLLSQQGMEVRPLGLAEGLGAHIPDDAALVAIMGPTRGFAPQELAAVAQYLGRGGRLLACLDPDRDAQDDGLQALLGVHVGHQRVGNPHYQVRALGQGASPYHLVTVRSASHPAVQSLQNHPGRLGLILLGAAEVSATMAQDQQPNSPSAATVTPLIYAMPDSFVDGSPTPLSRSPKSARQNLMRPASQNLALAAAVQWPEQKDARAVVVGDVDFAADGVLRNVGNSYFVGDVLDWLVGLDHAAGQVASEEDVPLVHRKDSDVLWFYGVSFGAPLLLLALGAAVFERDRKRLRELLFAPHDAHKEAPRGPTPPSL